MRQIDTLTIDNMLFLEIRYLLYYTNGNFHINMINKNKETEGTIAKLFSYCLPLIFIFLLVIVSK